MKPLITIITPTYNRSTLLNRGYQSLIKQTFKNFEWIIIDDGSTDNIEQVIETFKTDLFPIYLYRKKNGGKHTALNLGIEKAMGQYILMLDSDDLLPQNATKLIEEKTRNLPKYLGGIVGRKSDLNGKIVGSKDNFDEIISNSIDIRFKYGIEGDLTEIFKTSIFKKFLFPEIQNEKFCPEALVWNRIAKEYDLLFFNDSIYIADYQSDGLTNQIVKIRMQSPKASMVHYSELSTYNIPYKEKIKANINFWRFSLNDKDWSFKKKFKMNNKLLFPITFPLGVLMYLNDKRKVK